MFVAIFLRYTDFTSLYNFPSQTIRRNLDQVHVQIVVHYPIILKNALKDLEREVLSSLELN